MHIFYFYRNTIRKRKDGVVMKKDNFTDNKTDTFSNCHRNKNQTSQVSETNSDEDSSTSKYVVQNDDRERRDGPGGN